MATDTTALPAISAKLRPTFALQPVSELELCYDGATPPVGLLEELRALGWEGATPCPPPATAIDWSRPDPVRGTRHTIRSFPATTTALLHGTEPHRLAVVAATRSLLAGYGVVPVLDGRSRPAAEPAPAAAAPTGPGSAPAHVAPPAAPTRRVELVLASHHADEAIRRLADVGSVLDDQPDLWTTSITYRGNTQHTTHPARRVTVALRVEGVDVRAALAGLTVWSIR